MNPDARSDTDDFSPPSGAASTGRHTRPAVQVDLAGRSHQGKVRGNNEDHFLIVRFGRFLRALSTNLPTDHAPPDHEETGYGMVVADGMGGMAAGETASRTAIARFIDLILATPDWILTRD